MKVLTYVFLAIQLTAGGAYCQSLHIIPRPMSMAASSGYFSLAGKPPAYVTINSDTLRPIADQLVEAIRSSLGLAVNVHTQANRPGRGEIRLMVDPEAGSGQESYRLKITPRGVEVRAPSPQGVFYGIQTFIQLLPVDGSTQVACVQVVDTPRFAWRGLMLDVSRHFFTVAEVKRMIDQMAAYKFNLLHLHLTDDQGWRIEIKALPELTRVGAWRVPRTGLWWQRQPPLSGEVPSYGGYYTQDEIKELVAYAASKYVNILPEIDVPGHSLAAIAAYPWLSTSKKLYQVNPGSPFYGEEDNALSPIQDSTYLFLDKVFTEIAALFPFGYIHIGGDECFKGFWQADSATLAFMKGEGLQDVNELQSYFVKRVEQLLKTKGKKLLGWDEILEGGLAPEATVMSWRGMSGGITAAKQNHHVVMSPTNHAYLDLYQGDPAIEPPTYSSLRLKDVYAFEPVPEQVDASLILGGQGNLWTESVPTWRHAEYMLWPRSLALAEVLWSSPDGKDWSDFVVRTETHLARFAKQDINFARSFYDPIIESSLDASGVLIIKLSTELDGLELFYSFDNTYPDHHSAKYRTGEQLRIPTDADTFRVISYRNGAPLGRIITVSVEELKKRAG